MMLSRTQTGVLAAGVVAAVTGAVLLADVASTEPLPPARDSYPFLYAADVQGPDTVTYGAVHIPNPDATDGAELAGLNGVRVTYELDGKRITDDFPGAMLACAGALNGTCADRNANADLRQLGLLK